MEGEGGAAVQAEDRENATCVRELISSVASVLAMLGTLSSDQSARDKLLLERIRVMDEEISGLREQISNLSSQLSSGDGSSQSKKKRKNTKKSGEEPAESSKGSQPAGTPAIEVDGGCKIPENLASTHMSIVGTGSSCTSSSGSTTEAGSSVESFETPLSYCQSTGSDPTNADFLPNTVIEPAPRSASTSSPCEPRGRQSGLPPITDDIPWQTLSRSKPRAYPKRALYVGNLVDDTTSDYLASYVHQRAKSAGVDVAVEGCSLIDVASGSVFRGAHLLISGKHADMLLKRRFWPKPVYARPWIFRETSQPNNHASLPDEERAEKVISGSLLTSKSSSSPDADDSQGAADADDSRGTTECHADNSHGAVRLQNRFEPALSIDNEADIPGEESTGSEVPESCVEDPNSTLDTAHHQDGKSTPEAQDPEAQKACTRTIRPVAQTGQDDDPLNTPKAAVRSPCSDKIQEGSLPTGLVHRKMDKKATISINRWR